MKLLRVLVMTFSVAMVVVGCSRREGCNVEVRTVEPAVYAEYKAKAIAQSRRRESEPPFMEECIIEQHEGRESVLILNMGQNGSYLRPAYRMVSK